MQVVKPSKSHYCSLDAYTRVDIATPAHNTVSERVQGHTIKEFNDITPESLLSNDQKIINLFNDMKDCFLYLHKENILPNIYPHLVMITDDYEIKFFNYEHWNNILNYSNQHFKRLIFNIENMTIYICEIVLKNVIKYDELKSQIDPIETEYEEKLAQAQEPSKIQQEMLAAYFDKMIANAKEQLAQRHLDSKN